MKCRGLKDETASFLKFNFRKQHFIFLDSIGSEKPGETQPCLKSQFKNSNPAHSHLNTLIAIPYTTMPQIARIPICFPQSVKCAPSKETFLMASFNAVKG